jgi:rapamycin-insensitive companion of mTOR
MWTVRGLSSITSAYVSCSDGHSRIVLSKALTSSYKVDDLGVYGLPVAYQPQTLRLYATQRLGSLVRSSPTANPWTLRLLLTQLYDPSPDVCSMAVMFLQEACTSREVLQMLVDMQPTIDHLGDIGHPLTLKFMSATLGFRYLYDTGYINREIDVWFNVGFLLD